MKETVQIGNLTISSGKATVSDPCYDTDVWCKGVVENVLNGTYLSYVIKNNDKKWGTRNFYLIVHHECIGLPDIDDSRWKKEGFEVGVDSGQAGIYDAEHYHGGEDNYGDDGWYDECCNQTLNTKHKAGMVSDSHGVVSSSGYGDGGYDCKTIRHKGEGKKVVAIMIDFGCEG